jgi:hypothetical protein
MLGQLGHLWFLSSCLGQSTTTQITIVGKICLIKVENFKARYGWLQENNPNDVEMPEISNTNHVDIEADKNNTNHQPKTSDLEKPY